MGNNDHLVNVLLILMSFVDIILALYYILNLYPMDSHQGLQHHNFCKKFFGAIDTILGMRHFIFGMNCSVCALSGLLLTLAFIKLPGTQNPVVHVDMKVVVFAIIGVVLNFVVDCCVYYQICSDFVMFCYYFCSAKSLDGMIVLITLNCKDFSAH
jgi:hypothetical protein